MFQSPILDVAVGFILVFLILALICTSVNEYIAQILGLRAEVLWRGLCSLFQNAAENKAQVIAGKILDHNLVDAMSPPGANPSYIPSHIFAVAVLDLIGLNGPDNTGETIALRFKAVQAKVESELDPAVYATLKPLADAAESSLSGFQQHIEDWFNATMDRASGWYKRKMQIITFCVAIGCCAAVNADALMIGKALWTNPQATAKLAADAQSVAKLSPPTDLSTPKSGDAAKPSTAGTPSPSQGILMESKPLPPELLRSKTDVLGLIGWTGKLPWQPGYNQTTEHRYPGSLSDFLLKLVGLLATAIAASLGAPFWFGVLGKIASIRSSGQTPPPSTPSNTDPNQKVTKS